MSSDRLQTEAVIVMMASIPPDEPVMDLTV